MTSFADAPVIEVEFPEKLEPFLTSSARYKSARGGRGSAKSHTVAGMLIHMAFREKLRIVCGREIQKSIAESVHFLLKEKIAQYGMEAYWSVTDTAIRCKLNGSQFLFKGLAHNIATFKSTEKIDILWIEEAQKLSFNSWQTIIPTVREGGSEIWLTWNPEDPSDPTYKKIITEAAMLGDDLLDIEVNWTDNPWFPEVLRKEKDLLYKVDPDAAAHVWGGQVRKNSKASIFAGKWSVQEFTPVIDTPDVPGTIFDAHSPWYGPYFGADWGFSQDATTLVKCWLSNDKRKLYIEDEFFEVGVEMNDIADRFRRIPLADQYVIRADNARPETINHVSGMGLKVIAAEKWPNSVEDGIAFLRSFEEIIIAPSCHHAQQEARLYSFKVDKLTGDVLRNIVDKHNHIWDAVRYALQKMIKRRGKIYDQF